MASNKSKQINKRAEQIKTDIKEKSKRRVAKIKAIKNAVKTNTVSDNKLELLVTIVNRSKGEKSEAKRS